MCKKLVIVKYLTTNGQGEFDLYDRPYGYFIETRRKIEKGDFICIGADVRLGKSENEDRQRVSVVRVIDVVQDYKKDNMLGNTLISGLLTAPRPKILLGKADLKDYFAEIDKKHKIEELTQKIEVRFKEAEKMALYKKLAETDPEMKALLAQLEELK